MLATIREVAPERERARVISLFSAAAPMGFAAGPLLAAWLIGGLGLTLAAPIAVAALLNGLLIVANIVAIPDVRPTAPQRGSVLQVARRGITDVLRDPVARAGYLVLMLGIAGERMLRPAIILAELASEKIPFQTEVDLLREESQRNILDRLLTASAGPAFAASTGEPSRLAAPDLTALTQLQRAIVVPGRISVALAGDIDREDARSVVNACFPDTPGSMLKRTSREPVATTRIATLPRTTPLHVATGVFIPTSTGKAGMDIASAHAADLAVMNVIHQALRTQLTAAIPVSKNAVPQRIDASCSSILHRGLSGVLLRIDHTAASAQPVDMFLTALKAAQTLIADESQATGVITATRRIWAEQAALPVQVVARQAEWDAIDEPAGPVMLLKALSQLTPVQLTDHIDRIVLRFSLRQEVAL
jgi:hypothetical protein